MNNLWYTSYRTEKRGLADKYFRNVYLVSERLNEINTPLPGSFDDVILQEGKVNIEDLADTGEKEFTAIYGDGTEKSRGIPLFVFNYLDYKLWRRYALKLRGEGTKRGSKERRVFFEELGCSDFDLKVFDQFYFSRTRRSLEHYYPQANVNGSDGAPDENQSNCLGNYAMIGSEANSSGSNWRPKTKLDHYLDPAGKNRLISVASIKFLIMMQKCKDNQEVREPGQEWVFEDIKNHQERMQKMLLKSVVSLKGLLLRMNSFPYHLKNAENAKPSQFSRVFLEVPGSLRRDKGLQQVLISSAFQDVRYIVSRTGDLLSGESLLFFMLRVPICFWTCFIVRYSNEKC